jgi:YggT family protein
VAIDKLILYLLQIYSLLIIIRAIMSWVRVDPRNSFVQILNTVTDPILVPIQRVIPPIGGSLDISPIVAIVILQLLGNVLVQIF